MVDESRHPGGAAPGDHGADSGRKSGRPVPLPDWPAADIAWRPREADWAAEAAWSDLDTSWAAGAVNWGDAAETKAVGRRAHSASSHAEPADLGAKPAPLHAEPNFVEPEPAFGSAESGQVDMESVGRNPEPAAGEAQRVVGDAVPADRRAESAHSRTESPYPRTESPHPRTESAHPHSEPAEARRPPVDRAFADLSARYPELLPPLYGPPPAPEGHGGSNGVAYGRAAPAQWVRPVERPGPAPASPPGRQSGSRSGYEPGDDDPSAGGPVMPQPRPDAAADQPAARRPPDRRDAPADPRDRAEQHSGRRAEAEPEPEAPDPGQSSGRATERPTGELPRTPPEATDAERHGHRPRPWAYGPDPRGDQQHRPADPPSRTPSGIADPADPVEGAAAGDARPAPGASPGVERGRLDQGSLERNGMERGEIERGRVEPSAVESSGVEQGGVAERPGARPQPDAADPRPADSPDDTSAEPAGWTSPGAFARRRHGQPEDDRAAGWVRPLPSDPPARPVQPRAARGESAPQSAPGTSPAPASPPPPLDQPAAARTGAPDGRALPQRTPAEPDVPTAPEPAVDAPAETPELARIASHLRRPDTAPSDERPEGFDVNAILAAVRGVPGVADASLRTTPAGAHKLRLDLADGADSAEVSRRVARLLQEWMGLAAASHEVDDTGEGPVAAAEQADDPTAPARRVSAAPARGVAGVPAGPAGGVSAGPVGGASAVPAEIDSDEPVPRRRRYGGHRDRRRSGEGPGWAVGGSAVGSPAIGGTAVGTAAVDTAAVGTAAVGGSPTAERFRRSNRTTEPVLSRPLRPGTQPGPRLLIDHVQVSTYGLDAHVEVRLAAGEQSATGLATGPAVDSFVLRLCAAAAASAIDEFLRTAGRLTDRGRCFVEQAAIMQLGSCEVATVVVLLVYDGWIEQLAGSALVTGDPREAVVRATLAAVNRRLEALLS